MDGKLIEKLDRQRYCAVLLETAGLLLGFAETLWTYIDVGATPDVFALTFGGRFFGTAPGWFTPGLYMLIIGGLWYGIIYLKARRNPQVMKALYNEMYQEYKCRYQRMSLWIMIGIAILSMLIVPPRYPHIVVTEIIVLAGLLTMKISWLIYNRK